jgi:hypothetical protein
MLDTVFLAFAFDTLDHIPYLTYWGTVINFRDKITP